MNKDLKTEAIVVRRVNYGEADRILTLITPSGKVSAIAKGVRRERSKLAGGVEMFCLSELNLHAGKGELYTVTSAKMKKYFGNILKDFERMELAGEVLKKVNTIEDEGESFSLALQCLEELDNETNVSLVRAWFLLNVTNVTEGINLYRDEKGEKLAAEKTYEFDLIEKAFREKENGRFRADEIKLLRLMVSTRLEAIKKIRASEDVFTNVFEFVRMVV